MMSRYVGQRLDPEGCEVYVIRDDGKQYPLPLYTQIRNHSPTGFEWGYNGSGPAQLALAILADHFGPDPAPSMCPFCGSAMRGWRCSAEVDCGYDAMTDQWRSIQGDVVHYQAFKEDVVQRFPAPGFSIDSQEIATWILKHAKRPVNR
jgi:hypothetical protein